MARRTNAALKDLLADCKPGSMREAHEIQDATTDLLGETVRGWKVATPPNGEVARAALLTPLFFEGDCAIEAARVPYLGIEAEIAFRLDADLPRRATPYTRDDVAPLVSACPAIEVVHSRYIDFNAVTLEERVADYMVNGGFAHGTPRKDWASLDLRNAHVTFAVDGTALIDITGGHPAGDPLQPLVDLANHFRAGRGLQKGEVVTTGSFTGIACVRPGQTVKVTVEGLGDVQIAFKA